MSRNREQIDEHILAAYLSGDLPSSLRREIASYIAHNDDARDLLAMANDALDVADSGDGAAVRSTPSIRRPRPAVWNGTDEDVRGDAENSLWKVTALFASAVLVLTIIVAVLVFNGGIPRNTSSFKSWTPHIATASMQIGWPVQPGASEYHVVLYSEASGERTLLHKTQDTSYVLNEEETVLTGSDMYSIWILSIDVLGEVSGRSTALPIRSLN